MIGKLLSKKIQKMLHNEEKLLENYYYKKLKIIWKTKMYIR